MSRRLVAVLFLDLVGWTRLAERIDPEPLGPLLDQYYELCSVTVEEYGGEVEKFIGDAVMAVFGAGRSGEDDALRALWAAERIRDSVGALSDPLAEAPPLAVHCGIAAGEAFVARSSRAGLRVVGDVVNLAARLQSAAASGEILVNATVADLARPHFILVPVRPLALKGKAEPVAALRVVGPAAIGPSADGSTMVDRAPERARLRAAYRRVLAEQRSQVVVILGPPGIGKTRLVRETVAEFGATGQPPTVVFGHCPTYGQCENHVALIQILDVLARQATPAGELLRGNDHIAAVVAGLRGDAGRPMPGMDEISWVARELLTAATTEPLVLVWDNLEKSGQSLLLFIGHLVESLRDLPLLMICLARPELAERDVAWIRNLADGELINVGVLSRADSLALAASLTGAGAAGDAADVAPHALDLVDRAWLYGAGNPLFIRLVLESATGDHPLETVPPTIIAVVGAMIDRLPAAARRLLGAASVIGPVFTEQQLAFLGEFESAPSIRILVDRQLVGAGGRPGEYRFLQQPVHEVAYARLDKQQRLTWHRNLAEHAVAPGFHLEAAARLIRDLRPRDPQRAELARRASAALVDEGTAFLRQRDVPSAIELLDRALELARDGQDRVLSVAAIRLSDALLLSGDTGRALDVVGQVARRARSDAPQWPCVVQRAVLAVRITGAPVIPVEQLSAQLVHGTADSLAWCRFEQLRMSLSLAEGHFADAEQAAGAALEHARALEDEYEEDRLLAAVCEIRQWSPTPIRETLSGCAELAARFALDRFLLVPVLSVKARCLALLGDRAGALSALAEAGAAVEQLRLPLGQALVDQSSGLVSALAGRHPEARVHYQRAAHAIDAAGHRPAALTLRLLAARERAWQDRNGAAEEIAALFRRRVEMDVHGRLLCTSALAWLAGRGDAGTAAIEEAMALLAATDDPCLRGEVCFDLARAHRARGNDTDAELMADAAISAYATVGASLPMRRVRAWI